MASTVAFIIVILCILIFFVGVLILAKAIPVKDKSDRMTLGITLMMIGAFGINMVGE